jgi:branched-chain amino acid transport system permease protein
LVFTREKFSFSEGDLRLSAFLDGLRKRPALALFGLAFLLAPLVPGEHQKYIFLGLATGGAYALIAVGYTMVYGIIELINFAHGEVYMFGAYLALSFALGGAGDFSNTEQVTVGLKVLSVFFGFLAASFSFDLLARRPGWGMVPRVLFASLAGTCFGGVTFGLTQVRVPVAFACLLAMVWAALLGVVMEQVAYRPLRRAPRLAALITAIGLSLVLQNLAQLMWSASFQTVSSSLLPDWLRIRQVTDEVLRSIGVLEGLERYGVCFVFDCRFTVVQLFLLGSAVVLMLALTWLITRTRLGRAMRACAQDRDAAYLMGVDVDRVITWTFAIGSALGAAAGILVALYEFKVAPQMGYKAGVVAFSAAVLGGIGNIPGAVVGGLILGVAQAMSVYLGLSQWDIGISYAVMIAIILVQPEGLLGTQIPRKS